MRLEKYRKFIARARRSAAYWARVAVRDFTEELVARMNERGVSRAALADAAGVSPAYITKVLRGSENFTVATMVKLALAVGGKVRVHIADLDAATNWFDSHTRSASTTAYPEATEGRELEVSIVFASQVSHASHGRVPFGSVTHLN